MKSGLPQWGEQSEAKAADLPRPRSLTTRNGSSSTASRTWLCGFAVSRLPLDSDAVRALAKRTPDALIIDAEAYVDTRALLANLRGRPETGRLPVVLLGQGEAAEVAQFEIVEQLGRSLDLGKLLDAVRRVAGPLPG